MHRNELRTNKVPMVRRGRTLPSNVIGRQSIQQLDAMSDFIPPIIGPYESRPAVCRDCDARAVVVADRIAQFIALHLPRTRVEHVGSTAVPNCPGRGIVDMMIVAADDEMQFAKQALADLGFQQQIGCDHLSEDRLIWVGSEVVPII
jgi:hypothetical protein